MKRCVSVVETGDRPTCGCSGGAGGREGRRWVMLETPGVFSLREKVPKEQRNWLYFDNNKEGIGVYGLFSLAQWKRFLFDLSEWASFLRS